MALLLAPPARSPIAFASIRVRSLARLAWVVMALLIAGLYVPAVPITFLRFKAICPDSHHCGLTPAEAHALPALGLSPDAFALFGVALYLLFAVVNVAVAALLVWRKADDRMALLSAFALLTFGTVTYAPFVDTFVA